VPWKKEAIYRDATGCVLMRSLSLCCEYAFMMCHICIYHCAVVSAKHKPLIYGDQTRQYSFLPVFVPFSLSHGQSHNRYAHTRTHAHKWNINLSVGSTRFQVCFRVFM
jgi:hypothetical protein